MPSHTLYSNKQRPFGISCAEGQGQWEGVIPVLAGKFHDFALFVPIKDTEVPMKGIYIKGEAEAPPLLWGRYFDAQATWAGHPVAVLGKNYQHEAAWRDGKRYYTHKGMEYEVIGILGTQEESRLNQMVLVDFRSAVRIMGINTSYVLDAKKEPDIVAVTDILKASGMAMGFGAVIFLVCTYSARRGKGGALARP